MGPHPLMVVDEELAGLELVRVHDVQQLLAQGILFLQILPEELLPPHIDSIQIL